MKKKVEKKFCKGKVYKIIFLSESHQFFQISHRQNLSLENSGKMLI